MTSTQTIVELLEGLESLNTNLAREYAILKHQFHGIHLNSPKQEIQSLILDNTVEKLERDFQLLFIQRKEHLEIHHLNKLFIQIYSVLLSDSWSNQLILVNGVYIGGVMFLLYRAGALKQNRRLIEAFASNSGQPIISREVSRLFDYLNKP